MAKKKNGGEPMAIDKEIALELAKGSLDIYRRLMAEAKDIPSLLVTVVSREGNEKPEIHPIVNAIAQASETLRRQLSELLVTPKSKKQGGKGGGGKDPDDPFVQFVDKLNEKRHD